MEENFNTAKKNLNNFNKCLLDLITKLTEWAPEQFNEVNEKPIAERLEPISKESNSINDIKTFAGLKKIKTFEYLLNFNNNINGVVRESIIKKDVEVFDADKKKKYKPPINIMWGMDINFAKIWENNRVTKEIKNKILTYLCILLKLCKNTIPLFKITKEQRRNINKRKKVKNVKKEEIRKKIFELIGKEGENNSINIVVDDILGKFDDLKKTFTAETINQDDVQKQIKTIYDGLINKYETGEIDEDELVQSSKVLFNNVMENDDENLKENIGGIMDMMKNGPEGAKLEEIMKESGLDEGANPIDVIMNHAKESEADPKK